MRRRTLVPLIGVTLLLCAWLHARGVAALIGGDLAAPHLHVLTEAQASPEPAAPRSAEPILARNPFDSVTGPLVGVPATSAVPGDPTDAMGSCEGVHVVSIVAAADPDWSLVMLRVAGEREAIVRRRGAEVLAIGVDTVVLARAGKPCVARIFAPPTDDHAQPAPAANRSIVRTGPDSFALDRSARDALIEGAGELMRAVAVRPESQNGEVIGLRIATLKPGTPLDALGVRGGDVLLSLDGTPLISPDTMLQAYARVRTEEHVRLVVLRDGRQLQLDYEVR